VFMPASMLSSAGLVLPLMRTQAPAGLLRLAITGRAESFAEAGSFRSRAGVHRMRSPAGTPAVPRLQVRNGPGAGSG
jgi:hypothetical protein